MWHPVCEDIDINKNNNKKCKEYDSKNNEPIK